MYMAITGSNHIKLQQQIGHVLWWQLNEFRALTFACVQVFAMSQFYQSNRTNEKKIQQKQNECRKRCIMAHRHWKETHNESTKKTMRCNSVIIFNWLRSTNLHTVFALALDSPVGNGWMAEIETMQQIVTLVNQKNNFNDIIIPSWWWWWRCLFFVCVSTIQQRSNKSI